MATTLLFSQPPPQSTNYSSNSSLQSQTSTESDLCDFSNTTSSSRGSYQASDQLSSPRLSPSTTPPNKELQLRFLTPSDYQQVYCLCTEWFPVEYPDQWYEAVTGGNDQSLYSLAACLGDRIVGLIVAELKPGHSLGRDDVDLICDSQKKYGVAYILSLGVVEEQRRHGIASLLLTSLLQHLRHSTESRAVYLHVLTTNSPALRFYEKHSFRVHKFLPYYYTIDGHAKDGFTYVLYLNGGHGPWDLLDYVQSYYGGMCELGRWVVDRVRRALGVL